MSDFINTSSQFFPWKNLVLRWVLYLLLAIFAVYYMLPLFVMVTTSLKSLEEIRTGSLISLPRDITFEAWGMAWKGACSGIKCEGLRPYFWNSVIMAVPAVITSSIISAPPSSFDPTMRPPSP